MPRVVTVSNRLPIRVGETIERTAGGLVSAMEGVGEPGELPWMGWPGGDVPPAEQPALSARLAPFGYHPVFLSEAEIDQYYNGYSNSSLWPVLHYMATYMRYRPEWWAAYRAVNERFADVVANAVRDDDIVWVHDYHLMLLPAMLRRRRPDLTIGFFLHTPFPSYEVFRCLPQRDELLRGLLGADQIGFHTFGYLRHFRSAVLRILGVEPSINHVLHDGRATHIGVYPIGINSEKFAEQLRAPAHAEQVAHYRRIYAGRKIVLSVERLDYTKGILHRLDAIDRFLEDYPDTRQICFLMIAVPSRGDVAEYQLLREEVEQRVGKINGKHATVDNVPVHFIHQSVDFRELCALYAIADVALVTPLIDGMNLVAKEYVACQEDEAGMLILSEFAGAAEELFDAILVNPYDAQDVADKLRETLELPPAQRTGRMRQMRDRVHRYDARSWARSFIRDLRTRVGAEHLPIEGTRVRDLIVDRARARSGRWALCLDYDGTLREFESLPGMAAPTHEICALLGELEQAPDVDVFLVSGRRQEDMTAWFGRYRLNLIAEHGVAFRPVGDANWYELLTGLDRGWMDAVRPILRQMEISTPGSRIEEKTAALVWHYRRADPEFGKWKAHQLVGELSELAANQPIEVHHGKSIVEITCAQLSKGRALGRRLGKTSYAFMLCAGDDQTDESMFALDGAELVSVKIGPGSTAADYRLGSPAELRDLLERLLELRAAPRAPLDTRTRS